MASRPRALLCAALAKGPAGKDTVCYLLMKNHGYRVLSAVLPPSMSFHVAPQRGAQNPFRTLYPRLMCDIISHSSGRGAVGAAAHPPGRWQKLFENLWALSIIVFNKLSQVLVYLGPVCFSRKCLGGAVNSRLD